MQIQVVTIGVNQLNPGYGVKMKTERHFENGVIWYQSDLECRPAEMREVLEAVCAHVLAASNAARTKNFAHSITLTFRFDESGENVRNRDIACNIVVSFLRESRLVAQIMPSGKWESIFSILSKLIFWNKRNSTSNISVFNASDSDRMLTVKAEVATETITLTIASGYNFELGLAFARILRLMGLYDGQQ